MYLLGYTIECALKATLLERNRARTLEDLERILSRRFKRDVQLRTKKGHSIEYLFQFTSAYRRLRDLCKDHKVWHAYLLCNLWSTAWRYDPNEGSRDECEAFFEAMDVFHGYISKNV